MTFHINIIGNRLYLQGSITLIIQLQIALDRRCWERWRPTPLKSGLSKGWYLKTNSFIALSSTISSALHYITFLNGLCSKGDGKGTWIRSPHTPKAPRHGPRPPSRLKVSEMRQVAAVLFQESNFPSRCMVPSSLPKPLCKSLASNRVLFYEEELCQAVAQNKLL